MRAMVLAPIERARKNIAIPNSTSTAKIVPNSFQKTSSDLLTLLSDPGPGLKTATCSQTVSGDTTWCSRRESIPGPDYS